MQGEAVAQARSSAPRNPCSTTEILWYCNTNCVEGEPQGWSLYVPNADGPNDRLTQVVNGNGHISQVSYSAMANSSVYVQNPTDGTTVTYPLKSIIDGGRKLVSSISIDQGNGSFITNSYSYEGLATDVTGRGEQGFERINVVGALSDVRTLKTVFETRHFSKKSPRFFKFPATIKRGRTKYPAFSARFIQVITRKACFISDTC